MKRLILMRHAKTEPWFEGVDDHARALTDRGHGDAVLVAEALLARGWRPDRALVSSARRAHETWLELKDIFAETERQMLDALYLAGTRGLTEQITAHQDADTLLLIGHNPGLHDLSLDILRAAGSQDYRAALTISTKLPTGTAVLFEAAEAGPFSLDTFALVDTITPRALKSA